MIVEAQPSKAFLWSLVERIGTQAVRLFFSVLLARLLSPEEFGLIGILMAILGFGDVLVQSGLGLALIREPSVSHLDKCSIFFFNLALSTILSLLLFLAAPCIGSFYQSSPLTPILQVASIGILLNSLSIVPNALLIKEMRFSALGKNSMFSVTVAGLLGTALALLGCGVWSLVAQQLGGSILTSALSWFSCGWRPTLVFRWIAVRRFLRFGVSVLSTSLLDALVNSVYYAILGRLVTPADVGLYSRAKQIQEVPVKNAYYVVSRPSISMFARLQGDPAKLHEYFRSTVSLLAVVNFPVMFLLAAAAKPLVLTLLTAKWTGVVPLAQVLCLAGAFYPLQRIVFNLLATLGKTKMAVHLEIWRNALLLLSLALAAPFGVMPIICGQAFVLLASYLIGARYASAVLGLAAWRQFADIAPYLLVSGLMGLCMLLVGRLLAAPPWVSLCVQSAAGAVVFFALARTCKLQGLRELRRILRSAFNRVPTPCSEKARAY
jgi:O-antigen/teichoic acid export membrane protein